MGAADDRAGAPRAPLLVAPMRIEAWMVGKGARAGRVHRTGIGPHRASRAAVELGALLRHDGGGQGSPGAAAERPTARRGAPTLPGSGQPAAASRRGAASGGGGQPSAPSRAGHSVLLMGLAGALAGELRPGSVIVASELLSEGGEAIAIDRCDAVAERLRRGGVEAHCAPLFSARTLIVGEARDRLRRQSGASAVDMESWWFASELRGPLAVVRVVSDVASAGRPRPGAAIAGIWDALRVLRLCARALAHDD